MNRFASSLLLLFKELIQHLSMEGRKYVMTELNRNTLTILIIMIYRKLSITHTLLLPFFILCFYQTQKQHCQI